MTSAPHPPQHVMPFVRILGVAGAVEFLLMFGGGEVYLPTSPKARSALVEMIGAEKTAALGEALGHLKVRIPTAKPWIARVLRSEGLPVAAIARKLHTSDVTIRSYLRADELDKTQHPAQLRLL